MSYKQIDRLRMKLGPLADRYNKVNFPEDLVPLNAPFRPFSGLCQAIVAETVARLIEARKQGRARMLTFGAHAIKNGLSLVLIELIKRGWITHLATNGAGIIHDWELAYQGATSEDVKANIKQGLFGSWEETGKYINLALLIGAYEGLGYGESLGKFVANHGLCIPTERELLDVIIDVNRGVQDADLSKVAAAVDLLQAIRSFQLQPGLMHLKHEFVQYGLQAAAYKLDIPFTGHPMIGHDIIYVHPLNNCAAIGRTAELDFLTFANSVAGLDDGGVYISLGSAVMSPMVFEKSLNMAQNLALQDRGKPIDGHFMVVVDLQPSHWDWSQGEPPEDNPDYYLRYSTLQMCPYKYFFKCAHANATLQIDTSECYSQYS